MSLNLSQPVLERIRDGEAVLFLGAGASDGAKGPQGQEPLLGKALAAALSHKFLSDKKKDKPLAQVADFCKYEAGQAAVEQFIRDCFEPLQPAGHHLLVPTFKWHSIVTTNFDLVVERAYDLCPGRLQQCAPVVSNDDDFTHKIRDDRNVLLLKLHGCVSRAGDSTLPLILASEEYARYRNRRGRLFDHFQQWATERTVIFCGYDVNDPNLQQILFDLGDLGVRRPTYVLVRPDIDEMDTRYWLAKRFEVLPMTFETFLRELTKTIPEHQRALSVLRKPEEWSVSRWLKPRARPSSRLVNYVVEELQHVHPNMVLPGVEPADFYGGRDDSWGAFSTGLDARRLVVDDLLEATALEEQPQHRQRLVLVKGYAGGGKTVALRRYAWDCARDFGKLVFWLSEGGLLRLELLDELMQTVDQPIFLVVDDVLGHREDISRLLAHAGKLRFPLTVAGGARTNEWNTDGAPLERLVDAAFELRGLSEREVELLLKNLQEHGCLGRLAELSPEQRRRELLGPVQRQLLVALYEATHDGSFREIVHDEFEKITPAEAKSLYLDVCTFHRLGIPVRAGLISRVSGIRFEDFRSRLLRPLEQVVRAFEDKASRDMAYRARHQLIAEFVFDLALPTPEARFEQMARLLVHMNLDYSSDERAFELFTKGRILADYFGNRELADRLYDLADRISGGSGYVSQQRALFEHRHPFGNPRQALRHIEVAIARLGQAGSLLHTKALILRRLANDSTTALEREKLRNDARTILDAQLRRGADTYCYSALANILLDEVEDRLGRTPQEGSTELDDRVTNDIMCKVEEIIRAGLQHFPDDEHLRPIEARLADLLTDHPRAIQSLERAFSKVPFSAHIAVLLARHYRAVGRKEEASRVLDRCIESNPTAREAHLRKAFELMADPGEPDKASIRYHLERSFVPGDSNFEAQFWYARHCYLTGDLESSRRTFAGLREASIPALVKNKRWAAVTGPTGEPRRFEGFVRSSTSEWCWIRCYELPEDVFCHLSAVANWSAVRIGARMVFSLAFSLKGPGADAAEIVEPVHEQLPLELEF